MYSPLEERGQIEVAPFLILVWTIRGPGTEGHHEFRRWQSRLRGCRL